MRDFLIKNYGFKSQDILVLVDDKYSHPGQPRPTRKEMFNAMSWLISDARPHDSLFFHYSGHGGQSPDASGKEKDGMDEVIFPVDYDDKQGDGPGDIIDDELHEALVHNLPPGVRLTALFDSCHSGTLLDLPYLHSAHGRLRSLGHISKRAQQRGTSDPGDVICLAACKDDETSADTREGGVAVGAMSWAFIQALEQNRNQTYDELLQHLRATLIPKYHQKAQISGTHPVDLQRQFTL
ncbi:peptidase C14 [Pholiota molesta]|nr:peptidase C14 [Pholiota molesta]